MEAILSNAMFESFSEMSTKVREQVLSPVLERVAAAAEENAGPFSLIILRLFLSICNLEYYSQSGAILLPLVLDVDLLLKVC